MLAFHILLWYNDENDRIREEVENEEIYLHNSFTIHTI